MPAPDQSYSSGARVVETIPIATPEDAVPARERVRAVARGIGFDTFVITRIATATSEIVRAGAHHGRTGLAQIGIVEDAAGPYGISVVLSTRERAGESDHGPGDRHLEAVVLESSLTRLRAVIDEVRVESGSASGSGPTVIMRHFLPGRR